MAKLLAKAGVAVEPGAWLITYGPFMLPAVRRELKQRLKEAQLAARKIFSFL